MHPLVQRHPKQSSTNNFLPPGVTNRSPTDSLESFNNLASKESQILYRNHREAKYEIIIHFLKWLSIPELKIIRDNIFDCLRKAKLNAFVALEPTDDGFGNPTDTVHFHILTDDERGIDALRELGRAACLMAGLQDKALCNAPKNEFDVECRELYDYAGYIGYVTKHNREDKVHLFIPGSRLQRFYFLNDWYIDADGNRRGKENIWNEIKQEAAEWEEQRIVQCLKQSERVVAIKIPPLEKECPIDYAKLQVVLDKETDRTLYDWYSILLAKPSVFYTEPPTWLTDKMWGQPYKCCDFLDAIDMRISRSEDMMVSVALKAYHGQ